MAGRVLCIRVCPSILLPGSLLVIGSLVFSETQRVLDGLRGPCGVVCDRAGCFEKKNFLPQKWGKWAKNGSEIGFFLVYRKI